MRMMRIPAVWTTNLVALLFGVGLYSVFAFIPEFVQTPPSAGYGFGASITESGLIVLPMTVTMFVFGMLSGPAVGPVRRQGRADRRLGHQHPAVLDHGVRPRRRSGRSLVAMALLGVGFGLAFSAMSNIIVDAVPSSQTGVASGMNANIRTIGGSIGAAVMASIITSGVLPGGLPKESGYTAGFVDAGRRRGAGRPGRSVDPALRGPLDAEQREQAEMAHGEVALVAGGTIVGRSARMTHAPSCGRCAGMPRRTGERCSPPPARCSPSTGWTAASTRSPASPASAWGRCIGGFQPSRR